MKENIYTDNLENQVMFRRHSIAVSPMIKPIHSFEKSSKKSKTREWIKLFLSGLIPLMIALFTIVTTT